MRDPHTLLLSTRGKEGIVREHVVNWINRQPLGSLWGPSDIRRALDERSPGVIEQIRRNWGQSDQEASLSMGHAIDGILYKLKRWDPAPVVRVRKGVYRRVADIALPMEEDPNIQTPRPQPTTGALATRIGELNDLLARGIISQEGHRFWVDKLIGDHLGCKP